MDKAKNNRDIIEQWLAVGGWRLAVGGWRLAVGGWRLVVLGLSVTKENRGSQGQPWRGVANQKHSSDTVSSPRDAAVETFT